MPKKDFQYPAKIYEEAIFLAEWSIILKSIVAIVRICKFLNKVNIKGELVYA
jgi:hypothetical protein